MGWYGVLGGGMGWFWVMTLIFKIHGNDRFRSDLAKVLFNG